MAPCVTGPAGLARCKGTRQRITVGHQADRGAGWIRSERPTDSGGETAEHQAVAPGCAGGEAAQTGKRLPRNLPQPAFREIMDRRARAIRFVRGLWAELPIQRRRYALCPRSVLVAASI